MSSTSPPMFDWLHRARCPGSGSEGEPPLGTAADRADPFRRPHHRLPDPRAARPLRHLDTHPELLEGVPVQLLTFSHRLERHVPRRHDDEGDNQGDFETDCASSWCLPLWPWWPRRAATPRTGATPQRRRGDGQPQPTEADGQRPPRRRWKRPPRPTVATVAAKWPFDVGVTAGALPGRQS